MTAWEEGRVFDEAVVPGEGERFVAYRAVRCLFMFFMVEVEVFG